ncbi:MAG: hypothetical protein FWG12_03700 [Holophagaceae bacterium]|nr:hypothetical protein [Holophagaceae bacterium]
MGSVQALEKPRAEIGLEAIPGIVIPEHPLSFGESLKTLALALGPEGADSLADFLRDCEVE